MGINGPAMAFTITNINNFIFTALYTELIRRNDPFITEAWFLPSKSSFELAGLREYLKVGIPSIGMLCFEWWSFEVMILISAMLSIKAVAVQIIVFNNGGLFFMPCAGL